MVFSIPNYPEFEFLRGNKHVESTEFIAHSTARVLTAMDVVPVVIPVIPNYQDVVGDFSGLLLDRALEFSIYLMLRTVPISKISYKMDSAELEEVKVQLQELEAHDFIRLSTWLWGALVVLTGKND